MKRIHRIGCLLFSIYFIMYAVSPLSAVYQQKDVIEQTASTHDGIRLLVLELLLSPQNQRDEGSNNSSQVLLRKKRATLSSDKLKTPKKQIKNYIDASNGITSSKEPRIWIVASAKGPELQNGSYLLHSGLSPPLV